MQKLILLMIVIGNVLFSPVRALEPLESIIDNTSKNLISEIHQGSDTFKQNPNILYAKVNAVLADIIDFPLITRAVMGSYYRSSTTTQQDTFEETFRTSMVELLTKSLILIEGESIRVLPLKKKPERKASVVMEVRNKQGTVYKLIYSMGKNGDKWWVRNIIVDGINLGLIYRNQFKSAMNERHNDIDAVIKHWKPQTQIEK